MNLPECIVNMQVRRAELGEASTIANVLYQAFVEYESLYTRQAFVATTPSAEKIQERWCEGPVWVAVQQDHIVGTVSAVPKGEALYIRSMALLPSARGHRAGHTILQQAEQFATVYGYQHMFLSTTPFLTRAIRLYEQFGFRRSQEGLHDLFGTPLFTMVKTLQIRS